MLHMETNGLLHSHLRLCMATETIQDNTGLYGAIWGHTGPYGAIPGLKGPYRAGPYGPYRPYLILGHTDPCGAIRGDTG